MYFLSDVHEWCVLPDQEHVLTLVLTKHVALYMNVSENVWVVFGDRFNSHCILESHLHLVRSMYLFTAHKHAFDVHTVFYPHVASCPPRVPSLPLNTMVLTTLTTTVPPGTTITIGCVDGYYTDWEEILTCGSDGQWRGNITQCRGMGQRDYVCVCHYTRHILKCHTIRTSTY